MNSTTKNILVFVLLVAAAIVAYAVFFRNEPSPSDGLSAVPSFSSDAGEFSAGGSGDQFLSALLNLQTIRLDDSLFADPSFSSLKDFTIILAQPASVGRPNPFAPIGSTSPSSSLPADTGLLPL